ncbi:MAG: HAMP domain-containing sensor histidine kinase, partial [Opitutaceae bacterium]
MSPPPEPKPPGVASFRTKLLVAMMLVVSAVTALGLFFAQRNVAAAVQRDLRQEFQNALAALHAAQELRYAALAERCRTLAQKPRIHAALEDNALDLLYPSARDELADVMENPEAPPRESTAYALHARFYRFLDARGAVISPPPGQGAGRLAPAEEARLALKTVPDRPQTGYILRGADGAGGTIDEIIALPIVSTETGEIIAALVLGFKPFEPGGRPADARIQNGIWLDGRLQLPALAPSVRAALAGQVAQAMSTPDAPEGSLSAPVNGAPCLLFYKRLNPGSLFPPAYEVCIYPLTGALARQRRLFWQFLGAGGLLLLGALAASHFFSRRLSAPVEKLAVDSEENRARSERAEAALELTHEELQRSARFSADASHQLKTPVTVLRTGLEELLAGEKLSSEAREEVSTLVHQTFRLTSVIEDLLLLSRMDAGRLQLDLGPVNLTPLIEAWLDDLGALPDELQLAVETDFPPALFIAGEKRYTTLILQNLLENARKYNRPGGRIRISARAEGPWGVLTIGNTGRPISAAAREHVFERFHRGAMGENVPGHGLGLNLARELARLHRGDLRLTRSDEAWTEFEARFCLTQP